MALLLIWLPDGRYVQLDSLAGRQLTHLREMLRLKLRYLLRRELRERIEVPSRNRFMTSTFSRGWTKRN